jgi:hypothetical protein
VILCHWWPLRPVHISGGLLRPFSTGDGMHSTQCDLHSVAHSSPTQYTGTILEEHSSVKALQPVQSDGRRHSGIKMIEDERDKAEQEHSRQASAKERAWAAASLPVRSPNSPTAGHALPLLPQLPKTHPLASMHTDSPGMYHPRALISDSPSRSWNSEHDDPPSLSGPWSAFASTTHATASAAATPWLASPRTLEMSEEDMVRGLRASHIAPLSPGFSSSAQTSPTLFSRARRSMSKQLSPDVKLDPSRGRIIARRGRKRSNSHLGVTSQGFQNSPLIATHMLSPLLGQADLKHSKQQRLITSSEDALDTTGFTGATQQDASGGDLQAGFEQTFEQNAQQSLISEDELSTTTAALYADSSRTSLNTARSEVPSSIASQEYLTHTTSSRQRSNSNRMEGLASMDPSRHHACMHASNHLSTSDWIGDPLGINVAGNVQSLLHTPTRPVLVSVLGCVLSQLFSNPLDKLPSDVRSISLFHTERIPSIGIADYLTRIALYGEASEEVLVMAFIHISRIHHANQVALQLVAQGADPMTLNPKPFVLNTLSIHRLLLLSIVCSAKFFDDAYFNNHFYAKIGGITLRELNLLEIEFLALISFDLHIPSGVYKRFYKELCNSALHPSCGCRYREMPALTFKDELPESLGLETPLENLEPHSYARDQPEPSASAAAAAPAGSARGSFVLRAEGPPIFDMRQLRAVSLPLPGRRLSSHLCLSCGPALNCLNCRQRGVSARTFHNASSSHSAPTAAAASTRQPHCIPDSPPDTSTAHLHDDDAKQED